jgi:hypothetical protein
MTMWVITLLFLTATDNNDKITTQSFTITVANTNDAPTDISLSSSSISEGAGITLSELNAFYSIGTLGTTDVDASEL